LTKTEQGWSEIELAGHPCDIFQPAHLNERGYAVMYLHGVHQNRLGDQPKFTDLFEQNGLPVIAPRTKRSWWTDRICAEFDAELTAEQYVRENVVPYAQQRWHCSPGTLALLGTSMGGQGALRFAFKYPDQFPVVVAISPAVDYQRRWLDGDETLPLMYREPEEARQDTATLHVHPLNWPRHTYFCCDPADENWIDSSERLQMKLSALGIPHETDLETTGGGHGFQYYNIMAEKAIGFLVNRLERERLRIV